MTRGQRCPSCGTWIAAANLACLCGYRSRREAVTALASSLVAWLGAGAIALLVWAPALAVCALPLLIAAITAAVYGARSGWIAARGSGLDRVLGALALVLGLAFFLLPVALLAAARLR